MITLIHALTKVSQRLSLDKKHHVKIPQVFYQKKISRLIDQEDIILSYERETLSNLMKKYSHYEHVHCTQRYLYHISSTK